MLDRQDTLTVVALLVSLIALCIAVFQMLQASFLTAEGGRRCKSAIMGKWFILSRWKFLFSEFRFEVRFATPEITLVDPYDKNVSLVTAHEIVGDRSTRIFKPGSHPQGKDVRRAAHLLHWDTLPYRVEKMWCKNTQKHALKDVLHNYKSTPWKRMITWIMDLWRVQFLQESDNEVMGDVDAMVSWDVFIRMNFLLQHYALELQGRVARPEQLGPLLHPADAHPLPHGTFIAVNLRLHTWDLMPPDVVRPMARSKLGTILVLASRLGMEWQDLNFKEGKFRAEGVGAAAGSTLSSRTIHGLGLVLEFSASRIGKPPLISPSRYADMLFHGIIPGSPKLRVPEMRLIGDFRKTRTDWWYNNLRLSDKIPQVLKERPWWGQITRNDLLALTCPFLPSEDSPFTFFPYPIPHEGMNGGDMYVSTFRAWEARKMFLVWLSKKKDEPKFASTGNLRIAFEDLDYLEEHYQADFYERPRHEKQGERLYFPPDAADWSKRSQDPSHPDETQADSILRSEEADCRNVVKVLRKLREIHDRTTRYFEALQGGASNEDQDRYHDKDADQSGKDDLDEKDTSIMVRRDYNIPEPTNSQQRRLNYLDLVRADIEILAPIILGEHFSFRETDETQIRRGRHGGGKMGDKNPASIMERMILAIPDIIKKLRDPEHCRNGVVGLSDDQVEEAWWIMVLRGISWNMSVYYKLIPYEKMIPSYLYDSQVSVWLT